MNNTPNFTLQHAEIFLEKHHQRALFLSIASLPFSKQLPLLQQLTSLAKDLSTEPLLPKVLPSISSKITPFKTPIKEINETRLIGEDAIKRGKVLSLLLAGGDGSRLGFHKPKGCFEISLIKKKTLFQLHCEKVLALGKKLSCSLSLIILTSPNNHEATKTYFQEHHFFGLKPSQIFFISQPLFPLYTQANEWFLKSPTEIATGPNGNGGLFQSLTPLLEKFSSYEHLIVTNIDNPLSNLYDPSLIGTQIKHQAELSLRCFKKDDTKEKVGALAYSNNHLSIIDYTSLEDLSSFPYGNINVLCFSFSFIKTLCTKHSLPIHWIEKKGLCYDREKNTSKEIPILKGEKFITDTIAFAKKVVALDSIVEDHFAPLKNLQGLNDIASVQTALLRKDQKIFHELTGLDTCNQLFELSMDFHYPDETLIQKCKNLKDLPKERYITAEQI